MGVCVSVCERECERVREREGERVSERGGPGLRQAASRLRLELHRALPGTVLLSPRTGTGTDFPGTDEHRRNKLEDYYRLSDCQTY